MDGRQLAWRSAVVPVPAKGRARPDRASEDGASGDEGTAASGAPVPAAEAAVAGDSGGPGAGGAGQSGDPRARAIAGMVAWCREGKRSVWLVEGGAASGKTLLTSDVADQVSDRIPCGWARPGMGAFAVTAAARNGRNALLLVDDAETRADMLDLVTAVHAGGRTARIRVIIVARDFGPWWSALLDRLTPQEREDLVAGRTVLAAGGVAEPSARAVALRELRLAPVDARSRAATTLATADRGSAAVLLRQAAVVVALSTRVGQLGPAAVRSALRDLFEEEEGYWWRTSTEVLTPGQPAPALRSALASAVVLGADGLAESAAVLRRVPALAVGAADRLARLAVWWHGLYARIGDSAVAIPRLPSWLADRLPDGTDSTGLSWVVAALNSERRATATLARLTMDAHRDVWPVSAGRSEDIAAGETAAVRDALRRAVAAIGPVDEALAWLTEELELTDDDLDALCDAIGFPARSLSRTGIVLTRRLLAAAGGSLADVAGRVAPGDGPAVGERRAGLIAGLGARYAEVGRWDEARWHTEQAVAAFRRLAEADRDRYLPDLAGAVSTLVSCLSQLGDPDEALQQAYEAVTLLRELVAGDTERHMPDLARALANLSTCLARSGRRIAAVGAAGQAVALYRELAELNPTAYTAELAAADHNWRVCRAVLGEPVAGRRPDPD